MNIMITHACVWVFVVLPVVVLGFRAARPRLMPRWAAFLVVVVLGWALVLVAAMLNETPETGAAKVFALFFGWAYPLIWFVPWFLVFEVIPLVRRRFARSVA